MEKSTTKDSFQYTSMFEESSELFVGDDLIQESLQVLAEGCQSTEMAETGKFNIGKAAELIFNLSDKFGLPIEVKYVAVELFDKFMITHIAELREIVKSSSSSEKKLDWSSVESRIKDQVVLRAMTCVQIASKVTSHYKAVHPSKVKRYLSACNLHYSLSSVNKSEIRVLSTIKYKIPLTTPLVHMEILLEALNRNCEGINMKLIHKVALKVLDISYLLKDRLQDMLKYASENDEDSAKRRIVSNQFLLATCALVAACYVIDSSSNDMLIQQIAMITCLEENDIIIFSTILVKMVLNLQ